MVAASLGQIAAAARAFVPNGLYEPLKRFKILPPDRYQMVTPQLSCVWDLGFSERFDRVKAYQESGRY